jgi:hypothetical protein
MPGQKAAMPITSQRGWRRPAAWRRRN